MRVNQALYLGVAAGAFALAALTATDLRAQQGATVTIDGDDIRGAVISPKGPEAGVWVIAETADLPTKFAKMVVTDDRGRYVVPTFQAATYTCGCAATVWWIPPKVKTSRGKHLNLTSVPAPTPAAAAAEYYPGVYWYSMFKIPVRASFPAPGRRATELSLS